MIRGLYISGWSMIANNRSMDVITNNLANVNTSGYKKDTAVFQSFPEVLTARINDEKSLTSSKANMGTMRLGSDVGEIHTYYGQGGFLNTGDNHNLAIKDSNLSFFTLGKPNQDGSIKEYFTRDGAFSVNANKQLVNSEGLLVLGEDGPIVLEEGEFVVDRYGSIMQNGELIDKLLIKTFENGIALRKIGSNLVENINDNDEGIPFEGIISQRVLEQSNVNIVREMVDMISVMRSYETSQKLVQAQDTTLEKAVNEVGAVR